jgi:hypothetical protein
MMIRYVIFVGFMELSSLPTLASWVVLFLGIGLSVSGLIFKKIRDNTRLLQYTGIISFIIIISGFLLILFFYGFITFK